MAEHRYDTISFLSDYGLADEFVGVVRSVIRTTALAASRCAVRSATKRRSRAMVTHS